MKIVEDKPEVLNNEEFIKYFKKTKFYEIDKQLVIYYKI